MVESGYKNILVIGGDGTMSEAINGIFSADIPKTSDLKIALIPRGTGNDWGRFWGLTRDYKKSVEVLLKGKVQPIDIGKVEYTIEGQNESHYFINSIGLGLDAKVVEITHRMKSVVGSHSILYTLALLSAVFTYKAHRVHIFSEEKNIKGQMFTMNIANGCYSGGGMKQNPNAVPYDGLLDSMMAKRPTLGDILTALTRIFNGTLLQHPVIESFRSKKLVIQSEKNVLLEADGIIVNGCSPFTISVLPEAIQMIVP